MGNDENIKIFHPRKKDFAGSDLTSIAALMDKQRANGNSSKAVILGERLANLSPEELCPEDAEKLDNTELMQLRALMVFSSQIALHKYLPHTIISTQAVNAMYAKIEQEHPGFFANISDGSSFSFYYLTVRRNSNPGQEIGKDYAMLCDRDDNQYLIDLGTRIYRETEDKVLSLIDNFEFEY
ncbi:MAG: hypothetical protein IKH65_10380 [Clostridia bacterium]|jgi:hypothetical protein|nr:hypothetical protein [Clostridia bacterium]